MESEESIYAWEESLFDEDGQLWVVTMLSHLILPIYEEMELRPLLLEPLRTCLKHIWKPLQKHPSPALVDLGNRAPFQLFLSDAAPFGTACLDQHSLSSGTGTSQSSASTSRN